MLSLLLSVCLSDPPFRAAGRIWSLARARRLPTRGALHLPQDTNILVPITTNIIVIITYVTADNIDNNILAGSS